jgi:hypothetical protein
LPPFALCRSSFFSASASLHTLPPLLFAAVVAAPPLSDRFGRGIGFGNLGTGFSVWLVDKFLGFFILFYVI